MLKGGYGLLDDRFIIKVIPENESVEYEGINPPHQRNFPTVLINLEYIWLYVFN